MIQNYTRKYLKPVLMSGTRAQVKDPYSKKSSAYYLIKDKQQVIFVVSPGKNGVEFNKTVGYFSNFAGVQSFQCLYGQGIFLMQRNDEFGEAKEFKVVTLNPARQVLVPAGWGMCLVNTGINYLVILRVSLLEEGFQEEKAILEKQGFVYYVVEKKGEISFEENPNYSLHPQIATE